MNRRTFITACTVAPGALAEPLKRSQSKAALKLATAGHIR